MRFAIIILLLASSAMLIGQAPAVIPPPEATAHFAQHYPKANVKRWKQGEKLYRVEFVLKGRKHTAAYTAEGEWVRTKHDIERTELPKAVHQSLIAGKYGGWKITEMEEHNTPSHPSLFKVKLESEKQKAEAFFLPDGSLLKEEVKERIAQVGKDG